MMAQLPLSTLKFYRSLERHGIAPLCSILRLGCGWLFMLSGWGKLHHLPQTVEYFISLHVAHAEVVAPLTAGIEFCGGIALLLGLLTRPAAAALVGLMAGAIQSARAADIADLADFVGLQETLLVQSLLVLVVLGAGQWSVDGLLVRYGLDSANSRPSSI
jgi:putative oxidoreductase